MESELIRRLGYVVIAVELFVGVTLFGSALLAEPLFSSNDGSVCEQIYAPFFLNAAPAFNCLANNGHVATLCTSVIGTMSWNAYPLWADTLQPVGDDRTVGTDMVMHCEINYPG
jgi:hypothetical protein